MGLEDLKKQAEEGFEKAKETKQVWQQPNVTL